MYILTVRSVLLIVVLVYIIVSFIRGNIKNSDDIIDNKNKTNNETDINELDPFINSFLIAIYESPTDGEQIKLFNENFKDKISSIIIDNITINISHKLRFNNSGRHNVIIEFNKTLETTEEMLKDYDKLIEIIFNGFNTEYVI